jgi:SRSO17 transposase
MIDRALDAGTPAGWAAGDEVYGADPALRADLAARGLGYVLAVAKSCRFTTGIGPRRAVDLAVRLPESCWQRLSAGTGAKGERWYDWALVEVSLSAATTDSAPILLLIRRRISDGEFAFYRAHAPQPVPVTVLVRVAGIRWKIEESFAGGKELAALDEHQVRGWTSWHRWTVLAMLAHAFLSVLTATQPQVPATGDPRSQLRTGLVPLTRNEIRRLITRLTSHLQVMAFHLHWSLWRRHHQAVARACHFKRRAEPSP